MKSVTSNRLDGTDPARARILLVDENEIFLHTAVEFLRRQSELVVVGAIFRIEAAIAKAQDLEPQVVLVGLNGLGLEAIAHLRKVLPDVGIIALILTESDAYRDMVMAAGADAVVEKTELLDDLLPAIGRVMQAKSALANLT